MTGEQIACMIVTAAWALLFAQRLNALGIRKLRYEFYKLHKGYTEKPMTFVNWQMIVVFIALVFVMVGLDKLGILIIVLFSLSHLISFFMGKPND